MGSGGRAAMVLGVFLGATAAWGQTQMVGGNIADSGPDIGAPVKMGGKARTGALVSTGIADGDRVDQLTDPYRRPYVNDSPNIAILSTDVDVTTSATAFPASALPGRRRLIGQNLGTVAVYVGASGVTTTSGLRVDPGASISLEIGDDVSVYWISGSGTQDVRILELG